MKFGHSALAAGFLLLSAGAASAAVVTGDLNLRSGPGTGYAIIDTMPAGSHVTVLGCASGWCRVGWRGIEGFASAGYIAGEGYAPPPPRVYYAPPPVVTFGFGWGGPRWHGRHYRGGYYRGGRYGGRRYHH